MEMAGKLRTEIMSGYLKPGQFLLPEKELCQLYNISRNSLRQALDLLTNEGMLIKMVGRGTMVSKHIDLRKQGANVLNILCPNDSSFVDKALPLLIAMFQEQHPNVEIRKFGSGINNEALLGELSSFGVNADIVITHDQDLKRRPLEEYLPLDDIAEEFEGVHDKLLRIFRRKHRLYGLPLTYSPVFLACNANLFAVNQLSLPEEDWSMEQFIDMAGRINRDSNGDGLTDIYGFGMPSSLYRWPVLAMRLGYLFQQDEFGQLNMERLQEVLAFFRRIVFQAEICPVIHDWVFLDKLFEEGRLGMLLTTTLGTDMKHGRFPVKAIPLPQGPDAIEGSLMIANGLMIPKVSDNPDLAKLFVRFALGDDFQQKMAQEARFLSIYPYVNEKVWTEQERKALGADTNKMEQSYFLQELFPRSDIQSAIENELTMYWSGFETPAELIQKLKQIIK